jgi:hypothetical protein
MMTKNKGYERAWIENETRPQVQVLHSPDLFRLDDARGDDSRLLNLYLAGGVSCGKQRRSGGHAFSRLPISHHV